MIYGREKLNKGLRRPAGLLMMLVLSVSLLCGCQRTSGVHISKDSNRLQIVTTMFAEYDFARAVAGDSADIYMMIKPGTESHSFEPTPKDIISISNCDVFIYVGGENDEWVENVLETIENPDMVSFKLMDCVELFEEEEVEGAEHKHGHDHDEDNGRDHENNLTEEHDDHSEWDEHVWTDPVNGIRIVDKLTEVLAEKDPENADKYRANAKNYTERLADVDKGLKELMAERSTDILVFADRFPARYFTEEYELKYLAAFPGCAADAEPGAATIARMIDYVRDERVPIIFTVELSNRRLADIIAEETGAEIATFYTCHNVTKEDFEAGFTYADYQEKNLETLRRLLGDKHE